MTGQNISAPHKPSQAARTQHPPALLLEGSNYRRGHVLGNADELQAALLSAAPSENQNKLLLIRNIDGEATDILQTAAAMDPMFIEAHVTRTSYRPSGNRDGPGWWTWTYPALAKKRTMVQGPGLRRAQRTGEAPSFSLGGGCDISVCFHRASLWLSGTLPILLLEPAVHDNPAAPPISPQSPRNLVTHTIAVQNGCSNAMSRHVVSDDEAFSLEDTLLERMQDDLPVKNIVGEVILESWSGFIETLSPKTKWDGRKDDGLLWMVLRALEFNTDVTKHLTKRGAALDSVSLDDWKDLTDRIQRRVQLHSLCVSLSSSRAAAPSDVPADDLSYSDKDPNERSLDRIAYLGGILLPVTVVSSVLSIEGIYGPEGQHFWVFWVASIVLSVIALIVIYVDQVRTLHVWVEVAAGELFGSDDDAEEDRPLLRRKDGSGKGQTYWVQRNGQDGMARTWQRRELGWGGAVKKICRYERWYGTEHGQAPPERREVV
ncbi:hypothetical protein S40293_03071 [Stachybotrys chartarum IBT 40293]|nr:hypothetical protein S40293_03071 [Stachybotrys chartarum IBT 40293]